MWLVGHGRKLSGEVAQSEKPREGMEVKTLSWLTIGAAVGMEWDWRVDSWD